MDNQTDPAAPAATASADVPLRPAPSLSIFAAAPTLAPAAPQAAPLPDSAARLRAAEPAMAAAAAPAAAQETAPPVAPPISVAGLRSASLDAQGALWRKMRGMGPQSSPAGSPPRRAPVVPPPGERPGAAATAVSPRGGRFALLAASIALAAGVGAAAGGAGVAGIAWIMMPAPKPAPAVASTSAMHRSKLAAETRILKDGLAQVRGSVRSLSDNVGGVRANIDSSGKATMAQITKLNDQIAKLGDAVARLEHAQSEPAAKLSKVIDTLEKLERRAATLASADAPETTGSVPTAAKAVVRGAPPQPLQPPMVNGWVVRRVFDGVAMLDGPDRTIEVEPGDNIRGVGRVEDIQRQGNRWVVLTSRGMIVSR
jgi:hypothetical protein